MPGIVIATLNGRGSESHIRMVTEKLDPSSMRLLELINFPLDVPEGATHIAFFKDGESAQYVAFENGVGMFPAFAMVTYYPCNRFDV